MLREEFIRYIRFEKRYSPHTILAYQKDLDQFFDFLDCTYQTSDLRHVDHTHVRSWLVHLMEQGNTPKTVSRKVSTLKSYYKYLLRQKAIEKNPMIHVVSPKVPKSLPVFVDESRFNELLDATRSVTRPENEYVFKRDMLIVEMLYQTGMRLSELINLTHGDMDMVGLTIKILGKRGKERLVPIGFDLKAIIGEYIDCKRNYHFPVRPADIFFVTSKGDRLYPGLVYRLVKGVLENVTSLSKKSPHVLRHTFATHMLNHGAELNSVKELLGHANLAATQLYVHNTVSKLIKVYQQAHPKA
jgi:integrase/recombinase XerC